LGLDDVLAGLESLDYTAQAFVIPACAVGAGHRRDRVFIVAHSYGDSGGRSKRTRPRGLEGQVRPDAGGEGDTEWIADQCGSQNVADSSDKRRQERNAPTSGDGLGQYSRRFDSDGTSRPTQPGMGGSAHELSAEMDGGRLNAYSCGISETSTEGNPIDEMRGMRVDGETSKTSLQRIGELPRREDSLSEMPHESGYKVGEMGSRATQNQNMRDMPFGVHRLQPQQGIYLQSEMLVGVGAPKRIETLAWIEGRGLNPLDALAEFIARYPQPALIGQPQHEWEPPRVATGIKNRAARLKALGNAVDPLQIFPILAAIKKIDDMLRAQSAIETTESA